MRDWFYWDPPWVLKRVISLVVTVLTYAVFGLLVWAFYALSDHLVDLPWSDILCGATVLVLVGCNWYMMDSTIWD